MIAHIIQSCGLRESISDFSMKTTVCFGKHCNIVKNEILIKVQKPQIISILKSQYFSNKITIWLRYLNNTEYTEHYG